MEMRLTDGRVQAVFEAAVYNLTRINTVPCDIEVYGSTGLLRHPLEMIRAGGCYETPWTRDAAVNTWAAGRLLIPEAARNTLFAVCVPDESGAPVIQPDDQEWDRVVWVLGAWAWYLAHGDREFLEAARGVAHRALYGLRRRRFDEGAGLYTGGSFFNDGISGYPKDLYEPGVDHSFVRMHPATEAVACLSTNCIYCEAWRTLDRMNALLGIEDPAPMERHFAMKRAICDTFYEEKTGDCAYLRYPDGRLDYSRELSGVTFGVLFGILPPVCLEKLHREKWGIPSLWPPFPGLYSRQRPGRHNNLIWPFLNGFFIQAASRAGMTAAAERELSDLTEMLARSEGLYEIYDACDGSVNGGWQIGGDGMQGHLWDSCRDQSWTASAFIGAVIHGVFGVEIGEDSVSFSPCVPEILAGSSLSGLTVRGVRYDVELEGHGNDLAGVWIDGKQTAEAVTPHGQPGTRHHIRLVLR